MIKQLNNKFRFIDTKTMKFHLDKLLKLEKC